MGEQNPAHAGRTNPGLTITEPPEDGEVVFSAPEVRRVWREHRRWVAAILLAHKPREADLDDLLQTVAVAVVRKIGDLRDPAAVKPWLRTVAINAARAAGRDVKRARRGLRLVREQADGDGATPAGAEATQRDEARRLMELARSLPDGYREPLLLRCVRGMSYRQIGEVLDLPETTVETRIARGRRMLRELAAQDASSGVENAAGVASGA
jgi:RNA polymerase sigma-70 factor (ECF subfamily)